MPDLTTWSALPGRIGCDPGQTTLLTGLREQLRTDGVALLTGLQGPAHLLSVAQRLMKVVRHPDSDRTGLTTITDLGLAGRHSNATGFSTRALPPHTDRSGVSCPPALLLTSCADAALDGGACRLIDGLAVHDDLAANCPEALAAFLRPRSTLFGGAAGYLGSVFADASDGTARRTIRLRLDDLVRFSPEVDVWVPTLRAAIDRNAYRFNLAPGEGYLLDNHRWLHAREAYEGPRVLYRLHGDPLPQIGLRSGIPLDRSTC